MKRREPLDYIDTFLIVLKHLRIITEKEDGDIWQWFWNKGI